ncbi:hypothetical protein ACVWYG_003590 [Pedobacter sp. UYEF25]
MADLRLLVSNLKNKVKKALKAKIKLIYIEMLVNHWTRVAI